jgi:hypothetical protein
MVHATVGIRALGGWAGGQIPSISWTSRKMPNTPKANRWLKPPAFAAFEELAHAFATEEAVAVDDRRLNGIGLQPSSSGK